MPRIANSDVRPKILEAAKERLWHFGFKKTTIDEIAADAGVGKGTVYLHFHSKEDIALAIVTEFKTRNVERQQAVARSKDFSPLQKLTEILLLPILAAHERCSESPAAQEMIVAVRPHIQAHMRPYLEKEVALLASVLEEGCMAGAFDITDTTRTARTLKYMCAGFSPPSPCVEGVDAIRAEVARIVETAFRGFGRHTKCDQPTKKMDRDEGK